MNKSLFFSSLVLVIFTGCERIEESIEDSIKIKVEDTSTLSIPSATVVDLPVNLLTPETESNLEEELETNNSRKDQIKTIRLRELNITIKDPPGGSFGFLNSIRLYIRTSGLPEREIACLDPVPSAAANEIVLNVYDDELSAYLKQDTYSLRANIKTDEIITRQTEIEIYTRFEVTADLF